jgi:PAS domain S-box-containing protein
MESTKVTAIITASVAIFGFIYKYPYRWYLKKQAQKKEAERLRQEQEQKANAAFDKLNIIFKQFYNNGGSTLMDKVDKLVNGQTNLEQRFDGLEERFDLFEERQKFSLNSQNVAFWYSDKQGEVIYVSPALCKLIKRTESEVMGSAWISNLLHEDRNRISECWFESVQDKRVFDEIYTYQSDGQLIKVHGLAFHMRNKKTSEVMGSYGTLTLVNN